MRDRSNYTSRQYSSFTINDKETFKTRMLNWANQFNICCLLDNQNYNLPYHSYDCLLAVGAVSSYRPNGSIFSSLANFYTDNHDWIFGHFSYDLKNQIEDLQSHNIDHLYFPDIFLFVPEITLQLTDKEVVVGVINENALNIFEDILHYDSSSNSSPSLIVQPRLNKQEYIETVQKLREHIRKGDCYEINYCQEFFAENAEVDPLMLYQKLIDVSPNPFSAYYKIDDKYLLCASPERYLKKEGSTIISQPIKGTIKRVAGNEKKDNENKALLLESKKEKSENVMTVDLVRNDLSKVCKEGSVRVKELFSIYSFPQVHQMVSTVEGELSGDINLADIIKATFPMGSMTGAPKKKVMELIEKYETTKRGIFSGTVGYITPAKDFDFNVVIRSLMYNQTEKYLSYQVGSAITYNSNAEKEYEECLLKAEAIKKVLQ